MELGFIKYCDTDAHRSFAGIYNAVLKNPDDCPLKFITANESGKPLFDILLVREMTGGLYHGERGRLDAPCTDCKGRGCQEAYDTEKYSWKQIERALRIGYDYASSRQKKMCIVDKADLLESSQLWREVTEEVSKDFPLVKIDYLYINDAIKQLILTPWEFDVIVTSNMFGDILAGGLSALTGSQCLPSYIGVKL